MKNKDTLSVSNKSYSSLFSMSLKALKLINEGKEGEAHAKFPLEYHFLKKYYISSIDEFLQLLNRRLEII